jgi:integrase
MSSVSSKQRKPKPLAYGDGTVFQRKSDGRWIAAVRIDGRQQRIGSGLDEHTARAKLDQWHADRAAGRNPAARDWLLGDWLAHWLDYKRPQYDLRGGRVAGVEPTTWEIYEIHVRNHITPFLGSLRLIEEELDEDRIVRWWRDLFKHGRSRDTVRKALMCLSNALELAKSRRLVTRNVITNLSKADRPPAAERIPPAPPSEADLGRLLRLIDSDPLEAAVWLALQSGLRRGEVAGLRWEDITYLADDRAIVRARRVRNRVGRRAQAALQLNGGQLERPRLKSQAERQVPVRLECVEALRKRWKHQLAQRLAAGSTWHGPDYQADQPTGYLFTSDLGTPLEVDQLGAYFDSVRQRAGLLDKRFHGLRHDFNSLLGLLGFDERLRMEMSGHKNVVMSHHYTHPMDTQKWAAADALGAFLHQLKHAASQA